MCKFPSVKTVPRNLKAKYTFVAASDFKGRNMRLHRIFLQFYLFLSKQCPWIHLNMMKLLWDCDQLQTQPMLLLSQLHKHNAVLSVIKLLIQWFVVNQPKLRVLQLWQNLCLSMENGINYQNEWTPVNGLRRVQWLRFRNVP